VGKPPLARAHNEIPGKGLTQRNTGEGARPCRGICLKKRRTRRAAPQRGRSLRTGGATRGFTPRNVRRRRENIRAEGL